MTLQRNILRALTLPLICVLLISTVVPAYVQDAYGSPSQALQQRANEASSRVAGMEESLATAMAALEEATAELEGTKAEIAEQEEAAQQTEYEIDRNRGALDRQVDFMYRSGGMGYLKMLFSANTLSDFTSALHLVDQLASNDAQTIENLIRYTDELNRTLTQLSELREEQESIASARNAEASSAQSLLDEQRSYINSLNAQVQEALQREQDEANRQAATRPAPATGSNRESGSSGGSASSSGNSGSVSGGYISTGMSFSGIASWYEIGTRTANGEAFNPDAMTAAHQTLPFGTLVRVTFRGNSVVVRINDRGPFTGGRVIDLSRGAAQAIGLKSAGIGTVQVEVVQRP
jgi:rare lipoprotein A